MKQLKPLGKWVLVNVVNAEQKVGGLVLPEIAEKKPSELIVEDIGEEVVRVKKGDSIVFLMQNALRVDLPDVGKGMVLVQQDNILGVIV